MTQIRSYQRTQTESPASPVAVRAAQTGAGAVATGLQTVGNTLNMLQDEVDGAQAKQFDNQYSELIRRELYEDKTGFMYSQGGAAMARRGEVSERLRAAQEALLDGANDRVKGIAESAMQARYQRALQTVDQHTARERSVYLDGASEARINTSISDAVSNPDYVSNSIATAFAEIDDMAARNGLPPEVVADRRRDAATRIHSGVVERLESADPIAALEYLRNNKGQMDGREVERLEGLLVPSVREYRGRSIGRQLAQRGTADVSTLTRDVNAPGNGITNVSIDFNASTDGTARGTEVIVPDDATTEMIQAAETFNRRVVEFAASHGIALPNRGVKTTSENGRGVSNTIHAEPFFNTNIEMQQAIAANLGEFASIYEDAFGGLAGVRIIPPHGVGADRGAASEVFGNETEFGRQIASAIINGRKGVISDVMAMNEIAAISDPDERRAAMQEFELVTGIRDRQVEAERQQAQDLAFEYITAGNPISNLPLSVKTKIGQEGMSSLHAYEGAVSRSGAAQTDDEFYVQLSELMATNPDAFIQGDPTVWRSKLDDGDFQYFVKLRTDMMSGARGSGTGGPSVSSLRSAASTALEAAGFDNDPKVQAKFESQILRWSDAFAAENNRAPTPLEINDRVNNMLAQITLDPSGLGNKQTGRAFQIDYDGSPLRDDDDITPDMLRDGALRINDNSIPNEVLEEYALLFLERMGRAPTVQELVEGLASTGRYE